MAVMTKDGKGPYPRHTGEYFGNHHPDTESRYMMTPQEEEAHYAWLNRMAFGKPRTCPAFTSEDGEKRGYVGLYLKEDSPHFCLGDSVVPTPPELMEPGFEYLYNVNGKPGRQLT